MSGFLTIPEAPSYEVDAKLRVRNKTTGRFLKCKFDSRCRQRSTPFVVILINSKWVSRSAKTLRVKAVEAKYGSNFAPIISTQGRYEINEKGCVRHTRTKKLLKRNGYNLKLNTDDGRKTCSVAKLLWETFGIVKFKNSKLRVPVIISKGNCRIYFGNMKDAARYLAPRIFLSITGVYRYFLFRRTMIYGWRINYQC